MISNSLLGTWTSGNRKHRKAPKRTKEKERIKGKYYNDNEEEEEEEKDDDEDNDDNNNKHSDEV